MVDRKDLGSWLNGPQVDAPTRAAGDGEADYPGAALGLPRDGVGSIARLGRRIPALLIDWALCQLVAAAFLGYRLGYGGASGFAPLVVFFVMNLVLVGTAGFTIGHRLLGLRVVAPPSAYVGPMRAFIRTVLLCLAIPAAIWDKDNRGLHDKAAGTLLIRAR